MLLTREVIFSQNHTQRLHIFLLIKRKDLAGFFLFYYSLKMRGCHPDRRVNITARELTSLSRNTGNASSVFERAIARAIATLEVI